MNGNGPAFHRWFKIAETDTDTMNQFCEYPVRFFRSDNIGHFRVLERRNCPR
jgi:hypothetical protein